MLCSPTVFCQGQILYDMAFAIHSNWWSQYLDLSYEDKEFSVVNDPTQQIFYLTIDDAIVTLMKLINYIIYIPVVEGKKNCPVHELFSVLVC